MFYKIPFVCLAFVYFRIATGQLISQTKMNERSAQLAQQMLSYFLSSNSLQQPEEYSSYNNDFRATETPKIQNNQMFNSFQTESRQNSEYTRNSFRAENLKLRDQQYQNSVMRQNPNFSTRVGNRGNQLLSVLLRGGSGNSNRGGVLNQRGPSNRKIVLGGGAAQKLILRKSGDSAANIVLRGSGNALKNIILSGSGNRRIVLKGSGSAGRDIIVKTGRGPVIRITRKNRRFNNIISNRNTERLGNLAKNTVTGNSKDSTFSNSQLEQNLAAHLINELNSLSQNSAFQNNNNFRNNAFFNSNLVSNQNSNFVPTTYSPVETTEIEDPEMP